MFTQGAPITIPPMVSVFTKGIGWMDEGASGSNPASAGYELSDRAAYMPIVLPASCVVRRVWWANGADTAGGATIRCGVYADSGSFSPGAKIIDGSAVQGTASQVQFVDVTDTSLTPGLYWIAVVSSSATNTTLFRSQVSNGAGYTNALFRFSEDSATTLPATATPVESTTVDSDAIYLCGFSTTASP